MKSIFEMAATKKKSLFCCLNIQGLENSSRKIKRQLKRVEIMLVNMLGWGGFVNRGVEIELPIRSFVSAIMVEIVSWYLLPILKID